MSQAKSKTTKKSKIKKKDTKKVIKKTSNNVTKSMLSVKKKKSGKETESIEFQIGEFIVYPSQGVGKVVNIEKIKISDEKKLYYVIQIMSNSLIIKIPVDQVDDRGIRKTINKNDVKKVFKILEQEQDEIEEDWKIRYQNNLNKIKSGSIFQIAEVCRNLYKRARDKELSLMERRLYETAYLLVTTEISIASNIPQEEANNLVSEILSKQ